MTYRKRNTLFHLLLAALLAGGSSPLRAGVVIKGSVYGGGNEGEVQSYAVVNIEGGTIENNVFGGGNNAGVLKNDTVNMSDGTVKGSIYGGGNLGDVGTTTPIPEKPIGNYTWADGTGACIVNITGGTIGPETPTEDFPGNVFGGGKGSDYNFWCEKGMVYRTNVSIRKATVKGNVYGGGEIGRVETNTAVTIGSKAENADSIPTIKGSIFGAGKGEKTHGYSALVRGNTEVTVRNGSIVNHNVYGGGEIASVGKYNVDDNGLPYSQANNTSGNCRVNIPGTTQIMGDIFGGGKGVEPVDYDSASPKPGRMDGSSQWETFATKEAYLIYLQTLALATQTEVTIDPGNTESIIQSTKGSVYGGSENGIVQHDTKVTISGNCQIGADNGSGNVAVDSPGNVFGGGKGVEGNEGAGQVSGNATVIINSGTLLGSVYGGGVFGATRGNVTVNINGGTVNHNVYGGGALANTNTANWSGYEEVTGLTVGTSSVTDYYEQSFGGIFSKTKDTVAKAAKTYYRPTTATWASSTEKSALNKTRVNLRGGKIVGDAFGGALGDSSHEPIVYGDIRVNLNDSTVTVSPQGSVTMTLKAPTDAGCVVNNVFGCNNAKGTPKGDVMVHVYGTQNAAATHIANQSGDTEEATKPKKKGRYDVNAIYGGGNKAAYDPVDPTNNKTQVVIEGCDLTSIDYVYGGGNAAPVPATDVTVNSCYEIHTLFGGGNGSGDGNPGADVGIINQTAYAADNTEGKYGSGTALVKLLGGEIGTVYGGSNERGNIVGGATVNVNNESDDCELKVDHIYGAGNNAKMDGGTDIVLGCMPPDVIEEIYAGARNADVAGDVKLTLTSGTFGRVFGGNKHGGKLMGSITVNIEETGDCTEPLIIGELYGGGNLADYSIYGYKNTGTEEAPVWEARVSADDSGTGPATPYADPRLNIHAFTSIGAIYGGGYRAKMVANPTVDINVAKGSHAATAHAAGTIEDIPTEYKDGDGEIQDGDPVDLAYPAHEANKIGTIGNVFGGGNLAEIIGNATVNIGTEKKIYFKTEPAHLGESAYTQMTSGDYVGLYEVTVEGANIKGVENTDLKGSVYGGGNEANVTGKTQVNICAKYDDDTREYRRVAPGTAGVTIDHDVFGAGKGVDANPETALVSGNTTIMMMGGEVKQSVYGGGELSQVGGNTNITVSGGTIGKPMEGETRYGSETYGNIYGGGKGNTTNVRSGLIKGNTTITVNDLVATAGNAEYYGVSAGTAVSSPTILHNVYGGGAHGSVGTYTYASDAANAAIDSYTSGGETTINILGGTIGYDGHNNGMIFGSSRGDIDAPNTIYDNVAWVYSTNVIIGGEGLNPKVKGSVYGSGENGHTYQNTSVAIHSGTVGITETMSTDPVGQGGAKYPNRGNVYGGGCGTDKYYEHPESEENPHDGEGDFFNINAGLVRGNTTVIIDGGHVVRDVYGGGSMGAVGDTAKVTIAGNAVIGAQNSGGGYVFAAGRGDQGNPDKATVGGTTLNINGGTIWESAFGGGQNGVVKGSVAVNVTGGKVVNDVYGGGALANTNTDNWVNNALTADGYHEVTGLTVGESFVQGLYTESGGAYTEITDKDDTADGSTTYYRHGTTYNTTLNLTGGVVGNAYGGGLGQKTGINGATSNIEANVYGDVMVTANGTAFTAIDSTYTKYWYIPESESEYEEKTLTNPMTVPITGRVFGCNNINGTPKGDVRVSVRRTKRYDAVSQQVIEGVHEIGKYEIRGVYGGGNLSNYDPATGKKTTVDIHNCAETLIEKVYGGGNSANVPTTDVTIYGCFDIHYVFGGGNGADVIYRNGRWEENDGANVSGDAHVVLKGGTISDAFIGSDTKGTVQNASANVTSEKEGGDCTLKVTNFYGSSKRSDVYGDVYITVSACSDSQVENVYGGSYDAKIHGNITMTITSGILKNVYGGNDRLGSIGGDITINIEEADACQPIIIQNLYGGGYNAPYPGETAQRITNAKDPVTGYYVGAERSGDVYTGKGFAYADVNSGNITINIRSCTRIDNIFGGGKGANASVTGNTRINVNMAKGAWAQRVLPSLTGYTGNAVPNVESGDGYVEKADITEGASVTGLYKLTYSDNTYSYTAATGTAQAGVTYYEKIANSTNVIKNDIGTIGTIFGGGDEGSVYGNTSVYIAAQDTVKQLVYNPALEGSYKYEKQTFNVLGAHITGDVYGGGNLANVINGNTKVYICTADSTTSVTEGAKGVTIAGNVFGGGKGNALLFTCEKAMVGHDGDGYNLSKGNTAVVIGHGTVGGSVFGGGMIARVENNTAVTIGLGAGNSGTKKPVINGNVFGAGQGIKTHGYSALVRGKSTVTIGGDAWVKQSVYGGGDMASVGRFWVKGVPGAPNPPANLPNGMPYKLKDEVAEHESGKCVVTIQNHAKIGLDDMTMPTFSGHVFGAGKGALPEYHNYTSDRPRRMQMGDTWDPFTKEADYIEFIETLGMSAETDVTIKDNALVNGSVYGGSENGHVLHDTYVKITGGQIGHGNSTTECNHWPYGENKGTNENPKWVYLPYDVYKDDNNDGTPDDASDGHTFYGNVFGGGSGYFPYRRSYSDLDGANAWVKNDSASAIVGMPVDKDGYSDGKWLRSAGSVGGNTLVEITGGLIKTSVYGGNENTDVGTYEADGITLKLGGHSSVRMTGGTVGIERTDDAIKNHPVTCYLFGAGKGDQRINFNKWTNVASTKVEVSGTARIYGSVFGGGEDGHVLGNDTVNIGGTVTLKDGTEHTEKGLIIGTRGTSYVDGNVFGGGRGFSGEALTAGSVGGNVLLNIYGGTMLGSVYGGGRLASVGIDFTPATDPSYGQLVDDKDDKTHGHITMNISGGTIGNDVADAEYGGNVFGAGMGRNTKLDGSLNLLWPKVATSKTTTVNISRGTIKKNVYGGAEFGIVRNQATVTISGSADIKGSVFGAGKGSDDYQTVTPIEVGGYDNLYYTFTPMLWNGVVSGNTFVNINGGSIGQNVYGGGELASVGLIDFISDKDGNFTNMPKHTSLTDGFGLSWPYKFTYHAAAPQDEAVGGKTIGGKATVSISGTANIGTKVGDNYVENTGYVFGGSKGKVAFNAVDSIAEHRYIEAFCANVKETEVTLSGGTMRTVYGGGDDGHVYNDAKVTIDAGTKIENSVFGGGKGTDTFTTKLWDPDKPGNWKTGDPEPAHSWTAGKVYGNTSVTMNGGNVGMFIYGGGNMASVGKGNYAGGADDYSTAGYGETLAGNLWTSTNEGDNAWQFLNSGKSTVTILGGRVGPDINPDDVVADGNKDKQIDGDSIPYGSVFGGSRGQAAKSVRQSPRFRYSPDFFLGYVNKAIVNIGGTTESGAVGTDGPTIRGSIYGGGQDGHVRNSTEVRIFKGNISGQGNYETAGRSGNVFGAGSGIGKYDGTHLNNSSGSVTCTTLVEVSGTTETTTIAGSVYGGGALASVGPYRAPGSSSELHAPSGNHKSCSYTQVDIKGGNIKGSVFGASRGPSESFLSTAFPGGVTTSTTPAANQYNLDMYATDIWADVNILGGTIEGNVYGGGEGGRVVESTTVTLTGGVIGTASAGGDVFGSGKGTEHLAANVGGNTSVELNPEKTAEDVGCVVRRIFGCNDLNGTPKGHVSVHVYATQHRDSTAIKDKYPKYGNVTEYKLNNYKTLTFNGKTLANYATDMGLASEISGYEATIEATASSSEQVQKDAIADYRDAISKKKYDVLAVYGGGNLAPYEPTNLQNELTSVVIDGCELTSIKEVYGGGKAAYTPANSVLVNGSYELDEVFGGGNGKENYLDPRDNKWYQNPGANVGYKDFTHKGTETGADEEHAISQIDNDNAKTKEGRQDPDNGYIFGSGIATTTVLGGRIHYVYGGSNHRGNIRTEALSVYQESGYCDLNVDETTGAGKDADTDGKATLTMDCVQNVDRIFGGSTNADVYNDITLNITNGTFKEVYGGNNTNGAIYGSITVNIEEGGCQPIEIDSLYAGGYLAPYSIYGYETNSDGNYQTEGGKIVPKRTGANPKNNPRINVISASRIGDIYGGGYRAEVVGSPYINVNMKQGYILVKRKEMADGKNYVYHEDGTGEFAGKQVVYVDGKYVDGSTAEDLAHSYNIANLIQIPGAGNENKFMSPLLALGHIGNIYGGGNEADITGSTHIEIGTGTWITSWNEDGTPVYSSTGTYVTGRAEGSAPAAVYSTDVRKAAVITGSVFGGGLGTTADVSGNTNITFANGSIAESIYGGGSLGDVGTFEIVTNPDTGSKTYNFTENTGVCNVTITGGTVGPTEGDATTENPGNVFGAGMGSDANFECDKAMADSTNVIITNGTVKGSVYGGGKIARLEDGTSVTIGTRLAEIPEGETSTPVIKGYVYGAGQGVATHGYSGLVRGHSKLIVQGKATVESSIYGGGEMATVGKYVVVDGIPTTPTTGGICTVTVRDSAVIGRDDMKMTATGGPDDYGHVFGACKGVSPYEGLAGADPQRKKNDESMESFDAATYKTEAKADSAYLKFLETLALASRTYVTITDNAFVKGSVYGGSENGRVQTDTYVTIDGSCQIGAGYDTSTGKSLPKYNDAEFIDPTTTEVTTENALKGTASWPYAAPYAMFDRFAQTTSGNEEKYEGGATTHGGRVSASDGHSFYGNVFGGGSGYYPYKPGKWHANAGYVGGNTHVNIKGGHILTSVYGGNEVSSVKDTCYISMTGGTVGVPRTLEQIAANPVPGYVFGAGQGDPRPFFNSDSITGTHGSGNVGNTEVEISGGIVYGSVLGGAEDGHVLGNTHVTVTSSPIIGTWGTSGVDGNIFGGGRGLSGKNQEAGNVVGNATVDFQGGTMLGSIYGGGRLASVGLDFSKAETAENGFFQNDVAPATTGLVTINISGGTIGNDREFISPISSNSAGLPDKIADWTDENWTTWLTSNNIPNTKFNKETGRAKFTRGGKVYGGSMGRLTYLNGDFNTDWPRFAQVKNTVLNITGGTIKRDVLGGGELGTVKADAHVNISGGTVGFDVYGGGYGSEDNTAAHQTVLTVGEGVSAMHFVYTPMMFAGCVGGDTYVDISGGWVKRNVYGGGEIASVGVIDFTATESSDTYTYINNVIHRDIDNEGLSNEVVRGFALSWPWKIAYSPHVGGGTSNVNITGGRIGVTGKDYLGSLTGLTTAQLDELAEDNGDVFAAGEGLAGDRYEMAFSANVKNANLTIDYPSDHGATPSNYKDKTGDVYDYGCIVGAAHGGAENGHVIEDTHVTMNEGLIVHSLYGGGKGKGTYKKEVPILTGNNAGNGKERDIYSLTAGKVFGNTYLTMNGGYVGRNVYGGGNIASVGKGNYAGGADDYSTDGYGEMITGNLWTSASDGDDAWQFLNSGNTHVKVLGGTIGYVNTADPSKSIKNNLPYGNVFGGSAGEAAPNIMDLPRYYYCPAYFSGYVNETNVTIGGGYRCTTACQDKTEADHAVGETMSIQELKAAFTDEVIASSWEAIDAPVIMASVYGGGQDGHVRRDSKVTVNGGEIGLPFTDTAPDTWRTVFKGGKVKTLTEELDDPQWQHRGNIYGGGSGISLYEFDFNGDDDTEDEDISYHSETVKEKDHSDSSGSVTRFTDVNILGGTIHRNVYGGGSMGSVGAPDMGQGYLPYKRNDDDASTKGKQSQCTVSIGGAGKVTIGSPTDYNILYGGEVYGACRGLSSDNTKIGTSVWTKVFIKDGATIKGNVYGGGDNGMVKRDAEVRIGDEVIMTSGSEPEPDPDPTPDPDPDPEP